MQNMNIRSIITISLIHFLWGYCLCSENVTKVVKPAINYRLPRDIFPEYYKLNILTHLNDEEGFKYYGDVRIKLRVVENTKNITLHAKNLNITTDEITIRSLGQKQCDANYTIERTETRPDVDFFIMHVNEPLLRECRYELVIPFKSELSKALSGYYRSSYINKATQEKRWLAITQFEAIYARNAFPCFDEPAMKAQFEIELGHHKNLTAISNMPLVSSEPIPNQDDWVLDKFDVTVPMSTYLVAYSINDFEYRESNVSDVIFRIYARPEAIAQVEYAKEIGPKVLKYFEKTFKVEYPLPKMDMIAIPDFSAGAMENWGLITYRESTLLFAPNVSTSSSQYYVASVVAHELAHQWFGNLVTMKMWDDLWLNEGFATYVSSLGVHHLHPEWNSFAEESLDNTVSVFEFDSLKSSHPVSVEIGNPSQIATIFDRISYGKGSAIIRMMHLYLGHEVFFGGIHNYLNKYRYANAEQDNLWESLTEEAHKHDALDEKYSIKQIMDTWTLQTGYPIIHVKRDYTNNSATITQERYLRDPSAPRRYDNTLGPCWWVPLSYTIEEELDFNTTEPKTWLECTKQLEPITKEIYDLPEKEEWVLFNIQLAGLYKIRYDEHNWNLLIKQLSGPDFERISELNRAALINDALDLAWSSDQDYSIALKLMRYLRQERAFLPWRAAFATLGDVNRMLKRTQKYGQFKTYVQKILGPIFSYFGGLNANRTRYSQLDSIKHKVMVSSWSCRFDVGDCQEKAKSLFRDWMMVQDPEKHNPVPLDLRSVVYCTAIRHGGDKEWHFLWERYSNSNVGTEKSLILSALGCSREIWLLQRYLDWTLNESSGVRKQDRSTVFDGVAQNEVGLPLAKTFLFEKIDDIYKNIQPDTSKLGRYIDSITDQMVHKNEYDEFAHFFENRTGIFNSIQQTVQQSLETIHINNEWQQRNYENIGRLLTEY